MIPIKRTMIDGLKRGEVSAEEVKNHLMLNYNISEILDFCVELLSKYEDSPKIPISREDFEAHFRFIGMKDDGTPEQRGRKRKEPRQLENPYEAIIPMEFK